MNNKTWFERYLEAMEKTGDYMLRWQFQKEQMKASLLSNAELDRIADRVISRMSLTVDAAEVIAAIEDIQQRLDGLAQYGG